MPLGCGQIPVGVVALDLRQACVSCMGLLLRTLQKCFDLLGLPFYGSCYFIASRIDIQYQLLKVPKNGLIDIDPAECPRLAVVQLPSVAFIELVAVGVPRPRAHRFSAGSAAQEAAGEQVTLLFRRSPSLGSGCGDQLCGTFPQLQLEDRFM